MLPTKQIFTADTPENRAHDKHGGYAEG